MPATALGTLVTAFAGGARPRNGSSQCEVQVVPIQVGILHHSSEQKPSHEPTLEPAGGAPVCASPFLAKR
jgi:hypothetical protein